MEVAAAYARRPFDRGVCFVNDLGNACRGFDDDEIDELTSIAALYIQAGGLIITLSSWVGSKAGGLLHKVPADWQHLIEEATDLALKESYRVAFATQPEEESRSFTNKALSWAQGETWHKLAATLAGAAGGLGGMTTILVDLPVTTTLILRSIQQIAAGYGEDLSDDAARAQCLAVLGFGGPLTEDDDAETGLFASRLALSGKAVAEIMKKILPRFGVVVSEKVLLQSMPIIGAVTGATINSAFTSYYQTMAHVHFRLRRLEKEHEAEQVRACFERIVSSRKRNKAGMKTSVPVIR